MYSCISYATTVCSFMSSSSSMRLQGLPLSFGYAGVFFCLFSHCRNMPVAKNIYQPFIHFLLTLNLDGFSVLYNFSFTFPFLTRYYKDRTWNKKRNNVKNTPHSDDLSLAKLYDRSISWKKILCMLVLFCFL